MKNFDSDIIRKSLNANQFRAGMYLYSLLVDGLEVDTKKMVITE